MVTVERPRTAPIPPHDLELERGILGAPFYSPAAVRTVAGLDDALFYLGGHQAVRRAFARIAPSLNGMPPDFALVQRAAEGVDPALLAAIFEAGLHVIEVERHVAALRELAAQREESAITAMLAEAHARGADAISRDAALWLDVEERMERARLLRAASGCQSFVHGQSLAEFFAVPPPEPAWLVADLIREAANGWIGAAAKVGKSYLLLDLLLAAALGQPWLGTFAVARPLVVILVEEEDSAYRVYERSRRLCRGRGVEPPATFHLTVRSGLQLDDTARLDAFLRWAENLRPDLIAWDVFNRLHTRDEKRPDQMLPLLKTVDRIRDTLGVGNLIAHHSRKPAPSGPDLASGGQRLRGPSEFWGWAENSLYLSPLKGKGVLRIEPESKDALVEPFKVHLEDGPDDSRRWVYDGPLAAKLDAGSKTRQRIVEALSAGPAAADALAEQIGVTARTVKSHLTALLADDIVTPTREPGRAGRKVWMLADNAETPHA